MIKQSVLACLIWQKGQSLHAFFEAVFNSKFIITNYLKR